jgi:hypothetical protein
MHTFASIEAPAAKVGSGRPGLVRELLIIAVTFLGYRQIRYLTRNDTDQAVANARHVIGFERRLGVFTEQSVQSVVLHSETVVGLLNRYYVGVHFPLTATFVVWVLIRHPEWYRSLRTWMIGVTMAALVIHVAFPLAPPRMTPGFIDTLRVYGPNIYPKDTDQSVANQFAAMPSLHFGWAAIIAIAFICIKRTRWSLLALLHPVITLLAIVATANHYWIDAAVAMVLVAAGCVPVVRRSLVEAFEESAGAEHARTTFQPATQAVVGRDDEHALVAALHGTDQLDDAIVGGVPAAPLRHLDRQVAPRQFERRPVDRCVEHQRHPVVVGAAPLGDSLRQPARRPGAVIPPSVGTRPEHVVAVDHPVHVTRVRMGRRPGATGATLRGSWPASRSGSRRQRLPRANRG